MLFILELNTSQSAATRLGSGSPGWLVCGEVLAPRRRVLGALSITLQESSFFPFNISVFADGQRKSLPYAGGPFLNLLSGSTHSLGPHVEYDFHTTYRSAAGRLF